MSSNSNLRKLIDNMNAVKKVESWTALEEAKYRYERMCEFDDVFSSYSLLADTGSNSGKLEVVSEGSEEVSDLFDDLDYFESDLSNELQWLSGDTSKWVRQLAKAIEVLEEKKEERALKEEGVVDG